MKKIIKKELINLEWYVTIQFNDKIKRVKLDDITRYYHGIKFSSLGEFMSQKCDLIDVDQLIINRIFN